MPQLSQIGEIYASQAFWLAIVFALIYFGVGRAMVPRIERTIVDRAARVRGDLAAAEAARAAATGQQDDYQRGLEGARAQAAAALAQAQAEAARAAEARLHAGDAADAARLDAALARIDAGKAAALGAIAAETAEAAQAIVAKLSGAAVDPAAARAAAQRALDARAAGPARG